MTETAYDIEYTRQRDWYDPATTPAHVTLVGVGGIGSPTALALAKLGIPSIKLVDPDHVEPHNIPNQMFTAPHNGAFKVRAIEAQIHVINPECEVEAIEARGENARLKQGSIVISGLDSMESRKALWENSLNRNIHVPLYLDARLGGENIVIYAVRPSNPLDIEAYEETLYSDEQAKEAPCTRQSVIDVGFAVASLLTRHVRTHLAGSGVPRMTYLDMANLKLYTEEA